MAEASETDEAIQRKARGRGTTATSGADVIRPGKGITLVISNEYIENIIRIIKSLEQLERLIDGVSETVENEFFFYHDKTVHRLTSYKYIKNKSKWSKKTQETKLTEDKYHLLQIMYIDWT